jgi:hypothetical protein
MPYPFFVDKKVTFKIEHNDNLCKLNQQKHQALAAARLPGEAVMREEALLSGMEWYELQCFKAINQGKFAHFFGFVLFCFVFFFW